ncbi:MAG: GyrI-like domain-containing protein, partial [Planctomycetota bacterium]
MDIRVQTIEERQGMGARVEADVSIIGNLVGELIPVLEEALQGRGVGPHICRYFDWKDNVGVLEVARATVERVESNDRVSATVFPGGRAVVGTHVGPYEGLFDAWQAIHAYLEKNGLEGRSEPWEEYLNDCSVTP